MEWNYLTLSLTEVGLKVVTYEDDPSEGYIVPEDWLQSYMTRNLLGLDKKDEKELPIGLIAYGFLSTTILAENIHDLLKTTLENSHPNERLKEIFGIAWIFKKNDLYEEIIDQLTIASQAWDSDITEALRTFIHATNDMDKSDEEE